MLINQHVMDCMKISFGCLAKRSYFVNIFFLYFRFVFCFKTTSFIEPNTQLQMAATQLGCEYKLGIHFVGRLNRASLSVFYIWHVQTIKILSNEIFYLNSICLRLIWLENC